MLPGGPVWEVTGWPSVLAAMGHILKMFSRV